MLGCDIILVNPDASVEGCRIFAKNSDLTPNDVQELAYFPPQEHENLESLQCTHIEIEQVPSTYAVVASRPAWSWGIEMGANEKGVVIGSVAFFTKLRNKEDKMERLVDIDLNRLALERGATARECVDIICSLTEQYGQGGIMTECQPDANSYEGGYVVADGNSAWLVETAERHWAAREIEEPWFNLSNHYTITTDYDLISSDVKKECENRGFWDGTEPFNWAESLLDRVGLEKDTGAGNSLSRRTNGDHIELFSSVQ